MPGGIPGACPVPAGEVQRFLVIVLDKLGKIRWKFLASPFSQKRINKALTILKEKISEKSSKNTTN